MEKTKVRGFHLRFGSHDLVEPLKEFIHHVLVPQGINYLFLECNTSFVFKKHPEITEGTLTRQDAKVIADVCRKHNIRLIPLFQCLGHQGWGGKRNSILTAYPQFDETPEISLDAVWPEIFCRSWCPEHPDIHQLVYDLMDEIIEAFDADGFHVGMDEVFEMVNPNCPRCRGKDRAKLFANVVNDLHHHLVGTHNVEMFMWGDRLNDSERFGYNEWEGDTFGTHDAIDHIPKDIVITDWHYDKLPAYPSIGNFISKGFTVIPACWYKTDAAVDLLEQGIQQAQEREKLKNMPGMLVTSWNNWDRASFEKVIKMTGASQKDELHELHHTLHVITTALKD
ncbi:family 20 glycosylhydrolase [Virgibacillus salarius]|uniref:family 20 glycosylhydrolase n=1 Tax=Virgibacillus salarius TaxID=447199 RepID=UPI0031D6CD3B